MNAPDSHIYVGRLEEGLTVVFDIGGGAVERLGDFVWGPDAADAGVALARTVLTTASGFEPSVDVARRFAVQVIQRLPGDGFALPQDTVNAWLRRARAAT